MRQPSRKNLTRCNVLLLAPATLYRLTSYERDPCAVSVVTCVGCISLVLLPVAERPPLPALVNGLVKIRAAREHDRENMYALTPEWEERFLKTSMAFFSTMEAYGYVRQMDRAGRIADSSRDKIQKATTTLLCDTNQKSDFALPIAKRASKFVGPISRHHVAQILPMIRNAALASRPGLAVEEQTCRVGCPDEPDRLSHHNECLSSLILSSLLGGTLGSIFAETFSSTIFSLNL